MGVEQARSVRFRLFSKPRIVEAIVETIEGFLIEVVCPKELRVAFLCILLKENRSDVKESSNMVFTVERELYFFSKS